MSKDTFKRRLIELLSEAKASGLNALDLAHIIDMVLADNFNIT